uniref:Uncharacterized protein n=1 Tax=Oryza brachyantha TaxID=4533 RepID=J3LI86_ORYBR
LKCQHEVLIGFFAYCVRLAASHNVSNEKIVMQLMILCCLRSMLCSAIPHQASNFSLFSITILAW